MVETLFRSEFGNIKLGDILLTSQDEFLNEYGKSPQIKSLLRGWIAEYNLSSRFTDNKIGKCCFFYFFVLNYQLMVLEVLEALVILCLNRECV
jgi:hypothetical protein